MPDLKGPGRPSEDVVARLSYRVWAAMLRQAVNAADLAAGHALATSWSQLEHRLVSLLFREPLALQSTAKGLCGVAARGADPHRLEWRIDADEALGNEVQQLRLVRRRVSGPWVEHAERPERGYLRLPFDAVALGERLIPGSSNWLNKTLWWLVATRSPTIDEVRQCIASSLRSLELVRPTLEERRCYIGEAAYQAALSTPRDAVLLIYRAALDKLSEAITPGLLALLIALVKESYLTSPDELYDLHRDVTCAALERWFNLPALKSLVPQLQQFMLYPILIGSPIQNLPPTDPHNMPMTKADWAATVRTANPFLLEPIELPFLEDHEKAFR